MGCTKEVLPTQNARANFDYATSGEIQIEISAPVALAHATFELYTENPDSGGILITRAALDDQGHYTNSLELSLSISKIWLESRYIGLPGDLYVPILNGRAIFEVSGPTGPDKPLMGPIEFNALPNARNINTYFGYMGPYNSQGVPSYLTVSDNID